MLRGQPSSKRADTLFPSTTLFRSYPAMLAAIDAAEHTIALQTYIFDHDRIGLEFANALTRAHDRGVQIRVLMDAIGSKYSRPPILTILHRSGKIGRAHV